MLSLILIGLTALIATATLLREAFSLSSTEARSPAGGHPLVLLLGSLLSLMALFTLVRLIPLEEASRWPIAFHVGFICFWLLLMTRRRPPATEEPESGTGPP
jgi:hypothetical protein